MNAGPYLILHLVRGEPAFDVAKRVCPGPQPCQPDCGRWNGESCSAAEEWIIPTSGHRAHPWRIWLLEDLHDTSDINRSGYHDVPSYSLGSVPLDWPDHYTQREKPSREKLTAELLDLNITVDELAEALAAVRKESP